MEPEDSTAQQQQITQTLLQENFEEGEISKEDEEYIKALVLEQLAIEKQIKRQAQMLQNQPENQNQYQYQGQFQQEHPQIQHFSAENSALHQNQYQNNHNNNGDLDIENQHQENEHQGEQVRVPQQIFVQAVAQLKVWTMFLIVAQILKFSVPWILLKGAVDTLNIVTTYGFIGQGIIAFLYYGYILLSIRNKAKMLDIAELLNKVDYYAPGQPINLNDQTRFESTKLQALQYQIKDKISQKKQFFRVVGIFQFLAATVFMICGFVCICKQDQLWDYIFGHVAHSNIQDQGLQIFLLCNIILIIAQYHTFYFLFIAVLIIIPIIFGQWVVKQCQKKKKSRNVIKKLKPVKYKKGMLQQEIECSICMGNFEEGDKIIILPCDGKHPFHALCIQTWLKVNTTCPYCRFNLDEDQQQQEPQEEQEIGGFLNDDQDPPYINNGQQQQEHQQNQNVHS